MTTICIDKRSLLARGLEVTAGTLMGGTCAGLDEQDRVTLSDLYGRTVYATPQHQLKSLDRFLTESAAHPDRLTVKWAEGGIDRISVGGGQIIAAPSAAWDRERSATQRRYRWTRKVGQDTSTWEITLRRLPSGWRLSDNFSREQRLVRAVSSTLTNDLRDEATALGHTTWYVDGWDRIAAANDWMRDLARGRDDYAIEPRLRSNGTFDTLWLPAGPHGMRFPAEDPAKRQALIAALDTFVQTHRVQVDAAHHRITMNGYELSLVTAPGTTSVTEAELKDHLLGTLQMAPLLSLMPRQAYAVFIGEPQELVALAREHSPQCVANVEHVFIRDPIADGVYCPTDRSVFVLAHAPAMPREGEYLAHSATTVHELGHVIHFHSPQLLETFGTIHDDYVRHSFERAGVTSEEADFMTRFTVFPGRFIKRSAAERRALDEIWARRGLDHYFPEQYAIVNAEEHFAVLVEHYTPWHAAVAQPKYYAGFFHALDAWAGGGHAAFAEELQTRYGSRIEFRVPPVDGGANVAAAVLGAAAGLGGALTTHAVVNAVVRRALVGETTSAIYRAAHARLTRQVARLCSEGGDQLPRSADELLGELDPLDTQATMTYVLGSVLTTAAYGAAAYGALRAIDLHAKRGVMTSGVMGLVIGAVVGLGWALRSIANDTFLRDVDALRLRSRELTRQALADVLHDVRTGALRCQDRTVRVRLAQIHEALTAKRHAIIEVPPTHPAPAFQGAVPAWDDFAPAGPDYFSYRYLTAEHLPEPRFSHSPLTEADRRAAAARPARRVDWMALLSAAQYAVRMTRDVALTVGAGTCTTMAALSPVDGPVGEVVCGELTLWGAAQSAASATGFITSLSQFVASW